MYYGKESERARGDREEVEQASGRAGEREELAKNTADTVPRSHNGGWRASAS